MTDQLSGNGYYLSLFYSYRNSICAKNVNHKLSGHSTHLNDGSEVFVTKQYRNLFQENGHTENEISGKIKAAIQQLFHRDSATEAVYFRLEKNESLAYVSDVPHNAIHSEGMSYGMMICVQRQKKAKFDAIWNYEMTNRYVNDRKHLQKNILTGL